MGNVMGMGILLKKLNSSNPREAETLLRQLPEFERFDLQALKQKAKHKHALQAIAMQNGFRTWNELKSNYDQVLANTFVNAYVGGHLHKWFANYAEAKSEQQRNGGYLLPYKHQYFICDADYLAILGLDATDKDWQLIECDWVKPYNIKAWQRLLHKWLSKVGVDDAR